jgi:hypothetical protein
MTVSHGEFIRQFSLHILPKRLVKIRHYDSEKYLKTGEAEDFYKKNLSKIFEKAEKQLFLPKCSCCKTGNLHRIAVFDQRGPPP